MENGLDEIRFAATTAADDSAVEIALLESDLAVAEVFETVDPESAEVHRLGGNFER